MPGRRGREYGRAVAARLLAAGLLATAAHAAAPVAELAYVRPDGVRTVAFRLDADGTAAVDLRGELLTARLPAGTVERLRQRLSGEALCAVPQADFDALLAAEADRYAVLLPIPLADRCELTLPGGRSLACVGPGVLSRRMRGVRPVQDFDRVRRELEQLAAVVVLGGPEQLRAFLRTAADAAGGPVSLSSLAYADSFAGERVAHFHTDDAGGGIVVVTAADGAAPSARVLQTALR